MVPELYNHIVSTDELAAHPELFPEGIVAESSVELTAEQLAVLNIAIHIVDATDTDLLATGEVAIGDTVEVQKEIPVTEEQKQAEEVQQEAAANTVPTQKSYLGQVVVSDTTRTVNGIDYHHVRIADGSEYDLNEEDYQLNVV